MIGFGGLSLRAFNAMIHNGAAIDERFLDWAGCEKLMSWSYGWRICLDRPPWRCAGGGGADAVGCAKLPELCLHFSLTFSTTLSGLQTATLTHIGSGVRMDSRNPSK